MNVADGGRLIRRSVAILVVAAVAVPALLYAHAVVSPGSSAPGAYQRYVLSVPNEREAPTERVEITFPDSVRVVSFAEVNGWSLEVRRDAEGRIVGATWTGSLPPSRFVELPFVAVNPANGQTISGPVRQVYAGGDVVEWAGAPESDTPASVTVIGEAAAPAGPIGSWLGAAALIVALIALGFAIRRT